MRYRVFPLHPDTPENGLSLEQLFGGRRDVEAMLTRLREVAQELKLPLGERTHTYNSRAAQELGKWAEQQGKLEEFMDAVYRAYFAKVQNISSPEVLSNIAAGIDLDADEARRVMAENSFAAKVDADWRRSRELGIRAVPTLLYNTRALVGFRPYEDFRKLMQN